jgi:arginine decarboxylase
MTTLHESVRRLRVSTASTLDNPAHHRLDTWHALDETCRRLAAAQDDAPEIKDDTQQVTRLLDQLDGFEQYWLYPGVALLARLRDHLRNEDRQELAREVTTATRLLSEYGDSASLFDMEAPLADQELVAAARDQHYYTVLLADATFTDSAEDLATVLRSLRRRTDKTVYEVLRVASVVDAITAVMLNGEIQAAIIRHDLPLRAPQPTPLASALVNIVDDSPAPDRSYDWVECGELIRELRPHIDLYCLHAESIAAGGTGTPEAYNRTFYRLNDATDLHSAILTGIKNRYETPFFDALRTYADAPVGQFHALPVARGASVYNSKSLKDMGEFYGHNIFMAETSSTSGGLDSLLEPHGTIRRAMDKAAFTWGSKGSYFVTNGTSTANKIVVQALTRPGDIVLIDRNCHKSHHYGLVLAGAHPLYLDAYPLPEYAIYGAVPLASIKRALLDLEAAGQLDRVRMLLLTNCTFDGVVSNPLRVMEEVLAIKPDICFLWDEAWYAFATAVPHARQRTAMPAARLLEQRLASPEYRAEYMRWREDIEDVARSDWASHRLMADPDLARVRVYATHSTHKSLSALRQGSMIHIWDQDYNRLVREAFGEAYATHTSTSPNYQLTASLDLARRQVDLEGFQMVRSAYLMALAFRQRVARDPIISKWFHVLDETDLIPSDYRSSSVTFDKQEDGGFDGWDEAWQSDEFVLDPTRVTLYVGKTGMNGFEFRERVLMEKHGIQINKTSINSVLLIFTIGVTWSSVQYLLDALQRTARELTAALATAGRIDQIQLTRRIEKATTGLPPLPHFSEFADAFRPARTSAAGNIRKAFYAGYDADDREYVPLAQAQELLAAGRTLVSTTFVVPYPPGFPVLVPGQVISQEILDFMTMLDVKEIHGYRAELGLPVFSEEALNRLEKGFDGSSGSRVGGPRPLASPAD